MNSGRFPSTQPNPQTSETIIMVIAIDMSRERRQLGNVIEQDGL
jgi:hypothetical protein